RQPDRLRGRGATVSRPPWPLSDTRAPERWAVRRVRTPGDRPRRRGSGSSTPAAASPSSPCCSRTSSTSSCTACRCRSRPTTATCCGPSLFRPPSSRSLPAPRCSSSSGARNGEVHASPIAALAFVPLTLGGLLVGRLLPRGQRRELGRFIRYTTALALGAGALAAAFYAAGIPFNKVVGTSSFVAL